MKIAYNPIDAVVVTATTAANNDILFDLNARKVWAKGLRMGADWEDISNTPTTLPNPKQLIIFGVPYDGSKQVTITPNNYIYKVAKANITTNPITDGMAFIGTYYEPSNPVESVSNTPLRYSVSDMWNSWLKPKIENWYEKQSSKVNATLWGNKFTGTENISSSLHLSDGSQIYINDTEILDYQGNVLYLGYGTKSKDNHTYIYGGKGITLYTQSNKRFEITTSAISMNLPVYANNTMNVTNGLYLSSYKIGKLNNTTQSYTDPWQASGADFRFGGSLAATKIYASQGFYHPKYDPSTGETYLLTANGGTTTVKSIRSAIYVRQRNDSNVSYPLIWADEANTSDVYNTYLYKSYDKLTFNPSTSSLTVGGSVVASSFVKSGGTSQQLLRADGGIATFNWSGQSGQPTWLWGGNNQHSYYVYNPSNFRVAYATSSGNSDTLDGVHLSGIFTAFGNNNHNITATIGGVTKEFQVNYASDADKLDGYHENSFLRYRGNASTDQEATLWSQIGIKQYNNALPDNLTGVYNYGSVISLPGSGSRFEIYASHQSSSGNGLYYRSGWGSDKRTWLKFIDSSNIGSQSVNYANSAGNADTVDGYHASSFIIDRGGNYSGLIYDLSCKSIFSGNNLSDAPTTGWVSGIVLGSNWNSSHYQHYLVESGSRWYATMVYSNGKMTNWNTFAYLTDIPNPTNYYWANVKISASSSTTTSPTVSNLTATSSIRMGNILLEHTDEINNSTNGNLYLNYRSSGNISLCQGGGKVGIGTSSPSYKLDVRGSVSSTGFIHSGHNSNDSVLLAGGGYSQGVPVRYWAIYYMYIGVSPANMSYTKRSGNHNFITSYNWQSEGIVTLNINFPSGYSKNNTLIFGNGDHQISHNWATPVYVTIITDTDFGSASQIRVLLSNDSSLDTGYANIYFMCMG